MKLTLHLEPLHGASGVLYSTPHPQPEPQPEPVDRYDSARYR